MNKKVYEDCNYFKQRNVKLETRKVEINGVTLLSSGLKFDLSNNAF